MYLAVIGLVIVIASAWYTNDLAEQLAITEERWVNLYRTAVENIDIESVEELDDDMRLQGEIFEQMESTPQILVNAETQVIDGWSGFGGWEPDTLEVEELLQEWIEEGREPIKVYVQLTYIGESRLLQQLRYFPYIQGGLITAFILLGFYGINQARKAEQDRVWVGMAKETAHQLGTPISAIMGWVEHLKMMYAEDEEIMEVSDELTRDVDRLSLVANRFSKIGGTPDLEPANIFDELDKVREYMEKRSPRKVSFDFPDPGSGEVSVAINALLFEWVIENLLRNALDAMDGKGVITGAIRVLDNKVTIDITDTGKGITPKNVRKVFNPGFTTKRRGWGLGLSLVKRIVEEYHSGRIVVSRSEVGVGTTFTITMPRVVNA
ncbi:MAG: signal transduction histidine kinase [Neolewinella sp.]|jgi:signal transduction histidine kinase